MTPKNDSMLKSVSYVRALTLLCTSVSLTLTSPSIAAADELTVARADTNATKTAKAETKVAASDATPIKPTASEATVPPPVPAPQTEEKHPAPPLHGILKFGADFYYGGTNASGIRARNNDGLWAGFGPAFPSNLSLNWHEGDTRTVRIALGIGDMYTGSGTTLRQPVEAYYQMPGPGGSSVTVGKFYVPFATQEWEYEPKYGAMYSVARGRMNVTASLNYNTNRDTPNLYFRVGRQCGVRTSLGVSAGVGRGLFTDSSHSTAMALDLTHDFGAVTFNSEYNVALGPNGPFQFAFGKFIFTKAGRFLPYVGAYYWHDSAQELGDFRSLVAGLGYKLTPAITLETGYMRKTGGDGFWLQSHVNF